MVEAQRKVNKKEKLRQIEARGSYSKPKPGDCEKCLMTYGSCVCANFRGPHTIREMRAEEERKMQGQGLKVFTLEVKSQIQQEASYEKRVEKIVELRTLTGISSAWKKKKATSVTKRRPYFPQIFSSFSKR